MSFISLLIAAVDISLGPLYPMKASVCAVLQPLHSVHVSVSLCVCVLGMRCRDVKVKFKTWLIKTSMLTATEDSNKQHSHICSFHFLWVKHSENLKGY